MTLEFTSLNWVAVIAAAVVGMVVGFVWYLPMVFGKRWAATIGRSVPTMSDMSPVQMGGVVVLALVMAYVLTLLIGGLGANTVANGAIVGFLVWLGFAATGAANLVLNEGRSWEWWFITAGYYLVGAVVMGGVIGYLGA